ncbi:MAG: translational GTPase TypA [Verrucomicrobiota bacterium]
MNETAKIRNVAIVAHVDHGKTTLVDQLFRQSGLFRENQQVAERLMDSMDLERERGITITSKNGSFLYNGHRVNIIDTPGHADFGGQVERVLRMADGALLLVDAQEGPMPQTYFVLKKALALHLPIVVVINKIDKPDARPDWVVDQVFDLFVRLEAPHDILDFPVLYASSKEGFASDEPHRRGKDMKLLFDAIIEHIPHPSGQRGDAFQLQVSSIDYSTFLGRLGIGKITGGEARINMPVVVSTRDGELVASQITKLYRFEGSAKIETDSASVGDIVAVAGVDDVTVGNTYTCPERPRPLKTFEVDPPSLSMIFMHNDSPFAGREGKFVTASNLETRLKREILSDVALRVEENPDGRGFKVSGRGELHLSVLIEKMRREGYEFQVSCPRVIFREENGSTLEPYELAAVDIPEEYSGVVIQKLNSRRGQLIEMSGHKGVTRLQYRIPSRGLLGFRPEFMSDTKGLGLISYVFLEYGPYAGDMRNRKNGVLVSMQNCTTIAYALFNLQRRGKMFLSPGVPVYRGQIIGEHARGNDLVVNPAKGKQLTNMRAAGSDENVLLTPPAVMSLEDCISYINEDELVEVTPESIRLRKITTNLKEIS